MYVGEELSTTTANPKIDMPYPCLEIKELNDAITLIISGLEQGDLPVLATYEDDVYQVASISKSALTINKLVRVVEVIYHKTSAEQNVLRTALDIVEASIT